MGSNLDLRKVSWKKRVDVIPSRHSTDTETSSDEAPNLSHAQTAVPGEDHSVRQSGSQHASYCTMHCLSDAWQRQPVFLSARHDSILSELATFVKFSGFGPRPPSPPLGTIYLAANYPETNAAINCPTSSWWSGWGGGQAFSCANLFVHWGWSLVCVKAKLLRGCMGNMLAGFTDDNQSMLVVFSCGCVYFDPSDVCF